MNNLEKSHLERNTPIKYRKRFQKIALFFGLIWFLSFLGGCTSKLIYQFNNDSPDWLNSIVVGTFLGISFCSMGLGAISANFVTRWSSKSGIDKFKFIYALIFGIFFSLASLVVFWAVLKNLWVLIS